MKEPGIQYIGADTLTPAERSTLDKLSTVNYRKIQRMLKNMTSFVVHIKLYETAGKGRQEGESKKRRKYGIHVRAIAPTRMFASTRAHDWDIAKTLHKAFNELHNRINKSMRPDDQRPRRVSKARLRNL